MTPEEKEQHAEFCVMLAPVRQWLDEGALHVYGETGFNMGAVFSRDPIFGPEGMSNAQGPRDYAGNECGSVMCIAGAIGQFNNLDKVERATIYSTPFHDKRKDRNDKPRPKKI